MKARFKFLLAAAAISASATAANAATYIYPCPAGDSACYATQPSGTTFQVSGNPFTGTDSVTAHIGHSGISGAFEDIYQFIIGPTVGPLAGTLIGYGGGSLDTVVANPLILEGSDDLDFTSVLVNGYAASITVVAGGVAEFVYISGVPIYAGQWNTIDIVGTGGGNASYGGQASFTPVAGVPEPSTWAMMLLGFLAAGLALSRRAKSVPKLLQLA